MELHEIMAHWKEQAERHGTTVQATTRAPTAKVLEIDALIRAFRDTPLASRTEAHVLEVGCGNGLNCLALAREFPGFRLTGFDYVEEMIRMAREGLDGSGCSNRVSFAVGDLVRLDEVDGLRGSYDAIVSVRCLINLNTVELQRRALRAMAGRLVPGGYLMMVENSLHTFSLQNDCREALGLARREPSPFNTFLDEQRVFSVAELEQVRVEDFSSLHDLVLYVLVPSTNGGEVDYAHPLVQAATNLTLKAPAPRSEGFGPFGQNRLFVLRKS